MSRIVQSHDIFSTMSREMLYTFAWSEALFGSARRRGSIRKAGVGQRNALLPGNDGTSIGQALTILNDLLRHETIRHGTIIGMESSFHIWPLH